MDELAAALRDEVREMVTWRNLPSEGWPAHVPVSTGDSDAEYTIATDPLQRERLPEAIVPEVTVTVEAGQLRVEAKGRVLVIGLDEPVYHYEPDGQAPREHAGWLAELWLEDGS